MFSVAFLLVVLLGKGPRVLEAFFVMAVGLQLDPPGLSFCGDEHPGMATLTRTCAVQVVAEVWECFKRQRNAHVGFPSRTGSERCYLPEKD